MIGARCPPFYNRAMERVLGFLWLVACSAPAASLDASRDASPYRQPRLSSIGGKLISYDADGFPTQIVALYSVYDLSWQGGQLVRSTATFTGFGVDHTVTSSPEFQDGRLVGLISTCTGVCRGPSRTDSFTYSPVGSLDTWTVSGYGDGRAYVYDARGRVTDIDESYGRDVIEYASGDCPSAVMDSGSRFNVRYDNQGRLDDVYSITYNDDGFVSDFGGTGNAFRPLLYDQGEARGLDLWPGHFNGGYVYGFPPRGELFRLDGRCDLTLSYQPTVLTLAITGAFNNALVAGGG